MKKILAILGLTTIMAVFWAAPVSAQMPGAVTADPASLEVTGPGDYDVTFNGSDWGMDGLYYAPCPGALGDAEGITATSAPGQCPTIVTVIFASNITASGGSFSSTQSVTIRQEDIDAGAIVFAFGEANDLSGASAFRVTLPITTAGAGDTAEPTTTDTDTGGELPRTGVESGLLVIIGAGVILAGLLLAGVGRRLRRI